MDREEVLLFLLLGAVILSIIFMIHITTKPIKRLDNMFNMSFNERSNAALSENVPLPSWLKGFVRIFFGLKDEIKIYEFVVAAASFVLFFLFFSDFLKLTRLKDWQAEFGAFSLTVIAGFLGLIKIVGLALFELFGFLGNYFYQIIGVFLLVLVLGWVGSFAFIKIREKIRKEEEGVGKEKVSEKKTIKKEESEEEKKEI